MKTPNEPMFTLTSIDRHGLIEMSADGKHPSIRFLTPLECERLQAFPDNWTKGIGKNRRYEAIGNAVTTNVIKFLGQQLKICFGGKEV